MKSKGAIMNPKGSRSATLVALLLLMLPTLLAGPASANHQGRSGPDADNAAEQMVDGLPLPTVVLPFGLPSVTVPRDAVDVPGEQEIRDTTASYPFLDQQRDALLQAQKDALVRVNEELARRNLTLGDNVPSIGRVLEDHVDVDRRIGGVGPWRVLGEGWRIDPTLGPDGSAAFTMTDRETGKYGTMGSWLVSPALDLSAYVLQTGTLPYGGGSVDDFSPTSCPRACGISPETANFVNDQINLLFRHRYNLMRGEDGGQVVLFDKDPEKGGQPIVLPPMNFYGRYTGGVAGLPDAQGMPGAGFSGYAGWNVSAFDLTPWAGKVVWVGFRVGTGERAGTDPAYFREGAFPGPAPYGWIIDDVEVYAPAWGRNLKVFSVDGPSFRINATDRQDRVVPGSEVTVGATVLNAGANPTFANLTLTVDLDETVRRSFTRQLQAGEVWNVSFTITAPAEEEREFTVAASVKQPLIAANARAQEPPSATSDNDASRSFVTTSVRQFAVSLDAAASMVDDDALQSATATVVNTGNVPITLALDLWERYNATNETTGERDIPRSVTHERRSVELAAGARQDVSWVVTTGDRGAHRLQVNASAPGLPVLNATATYHVHASPAPAFAAGGDEGVPPGWDPYTTMGPVDPDGGTAWFTQAPTSNVGKTLRATPLPEAIAENPGAKYTDLQLKVRYYGYYPGRVAIAYTSPLTVPTVAGDLGAKEVWSAILPGPAGLSNPFKVEHIATRSWSTIELNVTVQERHGYADLWSLSGLEVRVTMQPPMATQFYLDDLRLTGVPVGKDESFRTELVRITGSDSPAQVSVLDEAGVPQGTAGPPPPSMCNVAAGTVVLDIGQYTNCWMVVTAEQLRARAADTRWGTSTLARPDGTPVVYRYHPSTARPTNPSDRLVTPVIHLEDATDPVLFVDHAYAFQGDPYDSLRSVTPYAYRIRQVGFLEAQYLQDDGTWSMFRRLEPPGGYRPTLLYTEDGDRRRDSSKGGADYEPGQGFFHPTACDPKWVGDVCDAGGFYLNVQQGELRWTQYNPTPYPEINAIHLKDFFPEVNLTNRPIRVALQTTQTGPVATYQAPSDWQLYGLRVTPVSRFAVDASATNLTLETAYDWRALGVAPGTTVPVNVTVRNEGLFPEAFSVRLDVGNLASGFWPGNLTDVGLLAPGEARHVILPWQVPDAPGRRHYNLTAVVTPTDNLTKDENRFNDRATLGADATLYAEAVRDVGISIQAFPARGDAGLTRYVPVTLYNRGNVALEGVTVERVIEYLDSGSASEADRDVYELTRPLAPNPDGIALTLATTSVRESDLAFTPAAYGTYLVTLRLKVDGVVLATDVQPIDNEARAFLEAVEPLYAEGFDDRVTWHTDRPDVWGEGPGFRSEVSLTAANRTSGLIAPGTDASIVSPRLSLANARTAIVNFLTKYDLEKGYDGGVVEVSTDNRTWTRVGPLDALLRPGPYPGVISSSNPLAAGTPPGGTTTAFTGSSADAPANLDGWTPVSFDLSAVPGVGELVVFEPLSAPTRLGPIPQVDARVAHATWMILEPGNPDARWEIRNEQYSKDVRPDGSPLWRWWSGITDAADTRVLARTFNLNGTDPTSTALVVTWWDRRPGTQGAGWEGVGADYRFRAQVGASAGSTFYNYAGRPEVIGKDGDWYQLRSVLESNMSRSLGVQLRFETVKERSISNALIRSATNVGWEVRGITFDVVPANNGVPIPNAIPLATKTGDENDPAERAEWFHPVVSYKWKWVNERTPRPAAPWDSVNEKGPDGRLRDMWKLSLTPQNTANVDARLVAPVIDLAEVGGGSTFLRVTHKYDLLFSETKMDRGTNLSDNKWYQAGTVEVEVFNRTTNRWDAPKQLYADSVGPSRELAPRPPTAGVVTDGAPYPKTLANAGDTFQRYPRMNRQQVGAVETYVREVVVPTAYAFSGKSTDVPGNADGWLTHDFDLSPYRGEKVRVVFHAWSTPEDIENRNHHWTIGAADVIGNVLSAQDVWVRLRLGTDTSLLAGSWSVDQMEVSGRRYARSIGLELDAQPRAVSTEGNVTFTGRIQNYGPGVRSAVAVGVQILGPAGAALPGVVPVAGTPRLASLPAGYVEAAGPFELAAAGAEGSAASFSFRIDGSAVPNNFTIRVVVLDPDGALGTYAPAQDDVPGRARREWDLTVQDTYAVALHAKDPLVLTPPYLEGPGSVVAKVAGVNAGTREAEVSAVFTWRSANGTIHAQSVVPAAGAPVLKVKPGGAFTLAAPPLAFTAPGNFTVEARLLNATGAFETPVVATRPFRVGHTDVAYAQSFDQGFDGWSVLGDPMSGPGVTFRRTTDEAYFGNASILFGYTGKEYEDGHRLTGPAGVSLVSPVLDLRGALPDASLSFWMKSRVERHSDIRLVAQRVTAQGDPACPAVGLSPSVPLTGRQAEWTHVRAPLVGSAGCPLVGGFVQVSVVVNRAFDQSWLLDGLTVASGTPVVTPALRQHEITDGARKEYDFQVTNTGAATREIAPGLDLARSRMTPEQAAWVRVTPERLALAPGASGTFTVVVETPSTRGLFPQPVNVSLALRDPVRPFALDLAALDLDFRPQPRADLAVAASIDGAPLGADRVGVEEGTPHEIGVLVSNLGLDASRPTDVRLSIVNESGGVVWEHRDRIEGLLPVTEGGEAVLVAATWKPAFGKRGNLTFLVSVDPERRQPDYDRSNSEVALPIAVTPLVRPDLVVDARSMKVTTPTGVRLFEAVPGQLVRISGVVRNDGLADAKQVTVRIVAGSSILKEEVVPLLKVGDSYLASTNQIAPPNTTSYQVVALTPDVEIAPDNNAQALELPILPPELVVSTPEAEIVLAPGERREVTLNVTNTAPYPTVVDLSMGIGARFASLGTSRLALGPGETRPLTLRLDPAERELAGHTTATILVESVEGVRTRKTVAVEVEAQPSASTVAYLARGPPQQVRVEFDAVNTGNVELKPQAVIRDTSGKELLRKDLPAMPPGKARFAAVSLKLPDATPPGLLAATLALEANGATLSDAPITLEVDRWGRIAARATPGPVVNGRQDVDIALSYEGNAPTVRQPVLLNAPQGVVATYSEASLTLDPGETRNLTLRIASPRAAPNGLYMLQAGFVDPDGETTLLGNLTGIPLDLRRAKGELVSARRVAAEVPTSGDTVEYVAKVRNAGDRAGAVVPVDLYVDGALVSRQLVEALEPGQVREVKLSYVAQTGRHAVVLAVDPHGPDADEALAFAETLEVAPGVVEGVPGLSEVPAPSPFLLVALVALLAALLRRRGGSR